MKGKLKPGAPGTKPPGKLVKTALGRAIFHLAKPVLGWTASDALANKYAIEDLSKARKDAVGKMPERNGEWQ